jgi:hypothetical protein
MQSVSLSLRELWDGLESGLDLVQAVNDKLTSSVFFKMALSESLQYH